MNKKICYWVTRHEPTADMRQQVEAAGFEIIQFEGYFKSGKEAYERIRLDNGGYLPDLIVAVLPIIILADLAYYAAPTPVVKPLFAGWQWTGIWEAIERLALVKRPYQFEVNGANNGQA